MRFQHCYTGFLMYRTKLTFDIKFLLTGVNLFLKFLDFDLCCSHFLTDPKICVSGKNSGVKKTW